MILRFVCIVCHWVNLLQQCKLLQFLTFLFIKDFICSLPWRSSWKEAKTLRSSWVFFFSFFFLFWKERLTHFAWFFSDILLRLLKQECRQKPYCNLFKKDFGKCIKGKIAKLTTAEFRQKLSSLFWCFCYHY